MMFQRFFLLGTLLVASANADQTAAENWVKQFSSHTLPSDIIEKLDNALSQGETFNFTKSEALQALWNLQSVEVE